MNNFCYNTTSKYLIHMFTISVRYYGMMEMVRIAQMEIVRIAKKGNSSTVRLMVELFPICAIR